MGCPELNICMNTLTQTEFQSIPLSTTILYSAQSHNEIGTHGEQYVERLFREAGYIVRNCSKTHFSGDLCIVDPATGETFKIEVKTARQDNRGCYGFCTRKAGMTDCSYSDFVALLCIDKHGNHFTYLVPVSCFGGQFTCITSHPTRYRGKYAPFRTRNNLNLSDVQKTAEMWALK